MRDGCLFKLLIVEIRLRMLPTPDIKPEAWFSSVMILWVFGRTFGLVICGKVPALN